MNRRRAVSVAAAAILAVDINLYCTSAAAQPATYQDPGHPADGWVETECWPGMGDGPCYAPPGQEPPHWVEGAGR